MKKIIAFLAALLVATPALADGPHGLYNRGHRDYGHHSNGHWVAPLVGGLVLGAIIADSRKEKEVVVVKQNCFPVTVVVQDQWGNILERRTETRCTTY